MTEKTCISFLSLFPLANQRETPPPTLLLRYQGNVILPRKGEAPCPPLQAHRRDVPMPPFAVRLNSVGCPSFFSLPRRPPSQLFGRLRSFATRGSD